MKILASAVVLLLALSWSMSISLVSAKYNVFVINNLDESATLSIHCASKDQDLGTHMLTLGGYFNWSFNINLWWTTLFYCDMSWGNVKGHFDVFVAKRDARRCFRGKCYWQVKKDGLYLYIFKHDAYELQFPWPHPIDV